ncbi:hypothetical protein NA56DRAFT_698121 [Hyaloscypha hepaticicola]|uniref:Uncharacterized protein n=1 Tax=Hyaloscypha hepaticicola TaxID=2082293 RepID=A0A2J6QKT7_9HELO|nr:hypothetical protein NA56DRAFT_698121 [Hyaloscypha hepaticicola]
MDSFESTNGMMGMGLEMDMDLVNEDDDFGGLSRGDLSRCPEALLGHYRSPNDLASTRNSHLSDLNDPFKGYPCHFDSGDSLQTPTQHYSPDTSSLHPSTSSSRWKTIRPIGPQDLCFFKGSIGCTHEILEWRKKSMQCRTCSEACIWSSVLWKRESDGEIRLAKTSLRVA